MKIKQLHDLLGKAIEKGNGESEVEIWLGDEELQIKNLGQFSADGDMGIIVKKASPDRKNYRGSRGIRTRIDHGSFGIGDVMEMYYTMEVLAEVAEGVGEAFSDGPTGGTEPNYESEPEYVEEDRKSNYSSYDSDSTSYESDSSYDSGGSDSSYD